MRSPAPATPTLLTALILGASTLAVSCEACKGSSGGSGGGGGGGQWLVGLEGAMLAADPITGEVRRYPLDSKMDLLDIACRGQTHAWVVGDRGSILITSDGGATWTQVDAGTDAPLRSIAVGEGGRVYAVGAGAFLASHDGGRDWRRIPASGVDLQGVAALRRGGGAIAVAADGSIHRLDPAAGALVVVRPADDTPLRGLSLSADGRRAIAVGDRGRALASYDGGETWRPAALPTGRTLHRVWLAGDGERFVAVGEAGVVVDGRWEGDATAVELLGEGLAFRGLHLEADGRGTIVGDRGSVLVTDDGGSTWSWFLVGDRRDLRAVDALRLHGSHL